MHSFEVVSLIAGKGDLGEIKKLVECEGLDVKMRNSEGFGLLHAAAMFGHTELVEYLLSKGADPNIQTFGPLYAPIHSASYGGHLETVKCLVKHGANTKLKNYRSETPKETAARQNHSQVVAYFNGLP